MRTVVVLFLLAGPAATENWPCFRGPTRQGVSTERDLPDRWTTTEGVLWKQEIPGEGWSSPIVFRNRVFVTTASEGGASGRLLGLDANSGKVLWTREVVRQKVGHKEAKNSWATPTPVADSERVYVVFGDGTFAALDHNGRQAWINRDYPHYSQHGLGASPVLHDGLLFMPRDGSSSGEDKKLGWQKPWGESYVVALEARTGKERWKTKRGLSRIAHGTPNIVVHAGRPLLVSNAGDVVQGFDAASGELLWTGRSQGEGVVPSVVIAQGLVFSVSGFEKPTIRTFRLGGRGVLGQEQIAWEQTKGVPMVSSLIHVAPYLYSVTTNGIVNVLNPATGELLSQLRIGGEHSASPVYADGKLYFSSEEGDVTVLEPGAPPRVISVNRMQERIQASPAVSKGRVFLRTQSKLYCVGRSAIIR